MQLQWWHVLWISTGLWEHSQQGIWPGLFQVANCWTWERAGWWGLEVLKAVCGLECKVGSEEVSPHTSPTCSMRFSMIWWSHDKTFPGHLPAPSLISQNQKTWSLFLVSWDESSVSFIWQLCCQQLFYIRVRRAVYLSSPRRGLFPVLVWLSSMWAQAGMVDQLANGRPVG
jgi:hypothetical protein